MAQVEKLRWLERNVLVAASRVLNSIITERNRERAEDMLDVCSDLIDLDITSLSIKILKHVSQCVCVCVCVCVQEILKDGPHQYSELYLIHHPWDQEKWSD